MSSTIQTIHPVKGIDPVADAFSGTVATDVVSLENYHEVGFLIYKGVGTTGTSTITVEACDNFTPSNTTAVAFRYRACTSGDTWGAWTAATAAGFTTTAGSSQIYQVQVSADDLAATGYPNARLKAVEVVNDPVLGGIAILLGQPKYGEDQPATAIA